MPKFINTELKSDSESDLDSDLEKIEEKIDNKLSLILILNKTFCANIFQGNNFLAKLYQG